MYDMHPDSEVIPHNIEAEQLVLGALLSDNERLTAISGLVTAESFYDPVHAEIYTRIVGRAESGQLASPITLKTDLAGHEGFQTLGGGAYLARLAATPGHSQIREYASLLSDLKAKRDLLTHLRTAREKITDGREGAAKIASGLETSAGAVLASSSLKPLIRSHLSSLTGALTRINDAYRGEKPPGVSSGLPQLDNMMGFFRPGNFIVLAGRPSMGKTTIAQNFAYHAATHGVGVFYGSFEMDGEDLGTRFLSLGLASKGKRVPYNRMIKGQLSESEMRDVVDETKAQMDLPLEFGERDVREVSVLRSAVKRARQKMADTPAPLGLVIVDYLQQLHSAKARSAYEHVSAASDACKSLAMELGVPVVALAQLSRNVEQRDPPVPMLADLRESGKVEEDADAVIFTYRDAYYIQRKLDGLDGRDLDAENDLRLALSRCARNVDLIVSKQRSGPTGTATAFIDPACCLVTPDLSSEERMLI